MNNKTYKDNLNDFIKEIQDKLKKKNIYKFTIDIDKNLNFDKEIYNTNEKTIQNIIKRVINKRSIKNKYKIKTDTYYYYSTTQIRFCEYYYFKDLVFVYLNTQKRQSYFLNYKDKRPIMTVEKEKDVCCYIYEDMDLLIYYNKGQLDSIINQKIINTKNYFEILNNIIVEYMINLYRNKQEEQIIILFEDIIENLNKYKEIKIK